MSDRRQLPGPDAGAWAWQREGLCRGLDSSLFFQPDHERGPARVRREARATALCADCPVVVPCRTHAPAVPEPHGTWGGTSAPEREAAVRTANRALLIATDHAPEGGPA